MRYPHAVKIPRLNGMADYSRFMIRELYKYVNTSHALIVQWDGYICDAGQWNSKFLAYDYIGAPWYQWHGLVGNGGFSLRSKNLLKTLAITDFHDNEHPEDSYICMRHRDALQTMGISFAPTDVAARFSVEARSYDGKIWHGTPRYWNDHFGFHSYLTPLPSDMDRPTVFHHGGDYGDIIYALPVIKALGGGVLFISPDNRFPWPRKPLGSIDEHWAGNLIPLLNAQPYIWQSLHTGALPFSVDVDLNAFREYYSTLTPNCFKSIFALHQMKFGVHHDDRQPWLTVDKPQEIPGRPIVVNRTQRYQNENFPWGDLVAKYGSKMIFVGTNYEHDLFKGFSPHKPVPLASTPSLLDVARVVAGAKVFIGNQSSAMAIALGLGKRLIQEVWPQNANCMLDRPGETIYWKSGPCPEIPDNWLE